MYNFNDFNNRVQDVIEFFKKDLLNIQTGRATPAVLENIMIESYGSFIPIIHVGAVNIEDAKSLFITVYDKSQISSVEKAINEANIGLSVSSQTGGVRVVFPALTGERRLQYVKIIKDKLEDARVKVRLIRENIKKDISDRSKNGEFGKDEEKRFLDDMQQIVDNTNSVLESIYKEKEDSILND